MDFVTVEAVVLVAVGPVALDDTLADDVVMAVKGVPQ